MIFHYLGAREGRIIIYARRQPALTRSLNELRDHIEEVVLCCAGIFRGR